MANQRFGMVVLLYEQTYCVVYRPVLTLYLLQGRARHPPDLGVAVAGAARRVHAAQLEGGREDDLRAARDQAPAHALPAHRPAARHQEEGQGALPGAGQHA